MKVVSIWNKMYSVPYKPKKLRCSGSNKSKVMVSHRRTLLVEYSVFLNILFENVSSTITIYITKSKKKYI